MRRSVAAAPASSVENSTPMLRINPSFGNASHLKQPQRYA